MDPPLPPDELRFMGESDREFVEIGDSLVRTISELGRVRPTDSIIDVGSGYGRLAHALMRSGFRGTYRGFEILKPHAEWTQAHLANERFQFTHIDIGNSRYNPSGALSATNVNLAAYTGQADLVVLTSVFTHMFEDEIANYFHCFPRMLRPGGRVICTFFLLTKEREPLIAGNASGLRFPYARSPFARYHDVSDPLHAIAYDRRWVNSQARKNGLRIRRIALGDWCSGKPGDPGKYQDFVLLDHA